MKIRKFFIIFLSVLIIFLVAFFVFISDKYVVPILMYHHVDYVDNPKPKYVSPENFEKQLEFIKNHNYNVISLEELVEATINGKPLSRKSVVITFDDSPKDNYTYAFKILKKYKFPATIFAPSDDIGKEGYLTISDIKEMIDNGISIGSHTRTQAYLPHLSLEEQRNEIIESKRILEKIFGIKINYIAYPIGGFSEQIKKIVKEAGYKGACATNRGYDKFNKDVYELNRIRLSDKDNRNDILWMKLSGYYNLLRKPRKSH